MMQKAIERVDFNLNGFLENCFDVKSHLARYLQLTMDEVERSIIEHSDDLAAMHPRSFEADEVTNFYEKTVGISHLFELASWHLSSSEYIADTLRLQKMFAQGQVLDFGGGIGTHSLAAAFLPDVDHVYFVDLNPCNREFVKQRIETVGLDKKISIHRDLQSIGSVTFDSLICLDVLEHLPDPAEQLLTFLGRLSPNATALLNWYFFKGFKGEYPFHIDEPEIIDSFFLTLQENFIEIFHPYLITTRAYRPRRIN